MLTLQITKDQMFSLLEQLSYTEQQEILQYLTQKLHSQPVDSQSNPDDNLNEVVLDGISSHLQASEHPINQISGKITAFQGVNTLAWQAQVSNEWVLSVREKIQDAIEMSEKEPPIDGEIFVSGILERFKRE